FSDPGADSPWHVTVAWGDASPVTTFDLTSTGTIPAKNHNYADGPNDRTVTVSVNDNTDTTSKTFSVHVNNVPPSIAISGNANVNEGSPYSLNLGAVTDPGTDTVSSYAVHWGDGQSDTYLTNGAKSHTYADGPNDYNVTVDLVDEDGTFTNAANALSVHVNNVAPTVTLSSTNDLSVNEGSSHTYSYTISDPGQDTVQSVTTSCGANGTKVAFSDANTNSSGGFGCTFPDGPATTNVAIKVTDSDGASDTTSESVQIVQVANVNPTVTAPGNQSSNEGASYGFDLGSFTDPGPDAPWSISVDWGDGSSHTTFSTNTTGSLGSQSHNYDDGPANQTVSLKVTDKNNGTDTKTFSVNVHTVAPTLTRRA